MQRRYPTEEIALLDKLVGEGEAILVAGREALFEDELSEEQVAEELAPLTVQLAFAASLQGRQAEALAAYEARAPLPAPPEICSCLAMPWRASAMWFCTCKA